MLPNPLHPAIVHFPVVLAFLLPLFALGAVWAIRRGARARRAWAIPLAAAIALALSAWAAVETGEEQGERVERVVSERPLSAHEEMAEVFLTSSIVLAVVATGGLVGGLVGRSARVVTAVGSLVLVAVGARVGHTGGQLVYRYGAANVYTGASASGSVAAGAPSADGRAGRESGEGEEHR